MIKYQIWASTSTSSLVDEVNVLAITANICDNFLTDISAVLLTYIIIESEKSKQYNIIIVLQYLFVVLHRYSQTHCATCLV